MNVQNVADALQGMRLAGLDDFGRWPKDAAGVAAMARLWHSVLADDRVADAELSSATAWFCRHKREFPSLSEFRSRCVFDRPRPSELPDPVVTGESGLGVHTLEDRSRLAPGQEFRELSPPSAPALPVTPEQRAKARDSLERAESKLVRKWADPEREARKRRRAMGANP